MKWIAVVAALFATPLGAHPHIFVDVGLVAIVDDQGRLTGVRVTWAYDALFSLLVTEDKGLDMDGDAVLTPEEEAKLTGFDMQWVEGYNGDLVGTLDGTALTLSRPKEPTAVMRAGRIVTTHLREIAGAPKIGSKTLLFKPFDPTYYNAYDVKMGVSVEGLDGCAISTEPPDLDSEMQKLQDELALLGQDQNTFEMGFPEVGEAFATQVQISCAGS